MTEQQLEMFPDLQAPDQSNILIKHSASIQITNRISMLARRISNVLLANARRTSPGAEMHEIEIADLRRQIHYNSRNVEHLYEAIKSLFDTRVRYNIFEKDSQTWGELHLLAEYQVTEDRILRYAYPPSIQSRLMSPNLYARLDLAIQNLLGSKHSLAMWEYLTDALGAKRSDATVLLPLKDFRELMSLEPGEYEEFSDLNKRIVRRAVEDLNEHTKLKVEVDVRRKGRKPDSLVFKVSRATDAASDPAPDAGLPLSLAAPDDVGRNEGSVEDEVDLLARLIGEFGLNAEVAAQICRTYPLSAIRENLDVIRAAAKKRKIANLAGYTVGALKRNLAKDVQGAPSSTPAGVKSPRAVARTKVSGNDDPDFANIQRAELWYAGLDATRKQRLKDLFIAGLSGSGLGAIQSLYLKEGPNHPEVQRAFLLHLATKLAT